jgi:DNA-binding GntR family transcriptional regulator
MPFRSGSSSSLPHDQTAVAYRSIRRMILDGGLLPGHRMSHRNLAEQLGLGRSPVRDAILQLEAEGLVVQRAQKGILLREPTPTELAEIYELRLVMEPFFAERAAVLATPVQLAALEEACRQLAAIVARPDLENWLNGDEHCRRLYQLDMQLHATILAAAGNSIATRIFTSAHVLAHVFAWTGMRAPTAILADRLAATAAEHTAIYEAIRDHDLALARERMRQHVLDAIPAVTTRYAQAVEDDAAAPEMAAAERAAAAVRRRKTR